MMRQVEDGGPTRTAIPGVAAKVGRESRERAKAETHQARAKGGKGKVERRGDGGSGGGRVGRPGRARPQVQEKLTIGVVSRRGGGVKGSRTIAYNRGGGLADPLYAYVINGCPPMYVH